MGELEEFREQVLDAVELNAEPAGLEVDVRGQGGDLVAGLGAQGDFHGGGLEVFANAFELGHQPPTPALLIAERLAVSQDFELLDELLAVEEESFAGLVAAEAVQQLDGLDRRLRPKSFSITARSRTGTSSRRSSSIMRGR